ncbi:mediator of RNA polymerase II transcription subunit 5 [Sporothrix schenckii 1099-18]|uniref:Mediator of RNA polymerase II transcription subunit 5 n=2 Tax=Sporothrix schenckii TaxID=29908 RepID=U7Q2J6_SPOS1|nr:mediator of RNA polymerase II transcription subunit 5 [Sporothrix schenckii 1099-18]ERT02083.1 hypothetical protein HMPREF1624_00380 [Sporothrix schenckii ATCC 58251]KJR80712.1 mediator of RNA polymerase II transcription subunit 5 [Sporothrix schenckii 1099-18]
MTANSAAPLSVDSPQSPQSPRSSGRHGSQSKPVKGRPVALSRYHIQQWANFIQRCLATRLDVDRFAQYAPLQQRKHPVSTTVLADLFLRPPAPREGQNGFSMSLLAAQTCSSPIDPRIPAYLQVLLQLGYVDVLSILRGLYRYSTSQGARKEAAATAAAIGTVRGSNGNEGSILGDSKGANGDGAGEDTDMLNNASRRSSTKKGPGGSASGAGPVLWANSYNNEETLFYRISRAVRQEDAIHRGRKALAIAACMAAWMDLFVTAASSYASATLGPADIASQQAQRQAEMEASRAAFAMLLLAVCENESVVAALAQPFAKGVRRVLANGLASFNPTISLGSAPVSARLEHFRTVTLAQFEPADKGKTNKGRGKQEEQNTATNDIHDLLDSTVGLQNLVVPEMPISNSRAGLYIYLNAVLVGRPLVDDATIFSYLNNRYQGDLQATAVDLILASFDVLANAVFRSEGQTSAHLLRSYLINKVPLLLASLAASPLYPFDSQYCISEALSRVDTNAFPTMSSMFDDNQNANTFTDSVRQDFCFACCLHGLVPEASIETLLGEITYQSLPTGGRYTKEQLVQQCLADSDYLVTLVGQLDNMDGNVGAVCQALVAMLGHLCRTRETATLKTLCNQLVRKPLAFDVLLLFERPAAILYPLCQLLDGWHYDEDQGEYQPIYEEFGSALFLLLAFVYRYNLTIADLGIQWSPDSFVARVLSTGAQGRTLVELSEQERENLGNWIRGLFNTDAGGLSDDLMSSCPPHQFYMLTPTLFQQIVQALSTGALPEDVLKGGIEYLVDTFLLPSLATALVYLSDALRVDKPAEQKAIIRILQLILQPASISDEATLMLSALLNIVAKPLEHALRTYQRQDPRSQDIDPLLKALKQNIPHSRRTAAAEHNELLNWAGTSGTNSSGSSDSANSNANNGTANNGRSNSGQGGTSGGLYAAMRQTVQGFVQWSLHPGVNIMPTSYTHRQFLAGLSLVGASSVLQLILDEVQRQTDAGSGSVAYDVACALICASDVTNEPSPDSLYVLVDGEAKAQASSNNSNNSNNNNNNSGPVTAGSTVANTAAVQRRISLRQALMFKAEEWKKIQSSHDAAGVAMAEAVVRLYRKVEAQMMPPPPPPPPPPAQTEITGLDVDDPTVAAAAAAAAGLDDTTMDSMVAAAAAAAAAGGESGGDAMVLDGVGLTSLDGTNVGGAEGNAGAAGLGTSGADGGGGAGAGSAGELGDLGDLGDLGNLDGLGDLGDLGDLGMGGSGSGTGDGKGGSLDLGDPSMFGDMDLLNSWIDYTN